MESCFVLFNQPSTKTDKIFAMIIYNLFNATYCIGLSHLSVNHGYKMIFINLVVIFCNLTENCEAQIAASKKDITLAQTPSHKNMI